MTASTTSVDMSGKKITTFIIYGAVSKMREMQDGEVLELTTDTDEAIENDLTAWSRMTGNKLLESRREGTRAKYRIQKAALKQQDRKLAMVLSNPGLEELISPLGFALGAALSGIGVSIYFQGPAVRVLQRGFKEKLGGMNRPFSSFARNGLARVGHLPPQEKLQQLHELGTRFFICGPSMDHFKVKKSELIFDDVTVAEYLTFMEIMGQADIHIYTQ